jgi:tetratricopeptide (TPR) repeat protein
MRPSLRHKILAIAVLLVALPICALAQGGNTITGFVFGTDRRGIERARVELLDDSYFVKQRHETDTSGRFVFSNIGPGRYQVRVLIPGSDYLEQTQDVNLMSGRLDTIQLEFTLRARKETSAGAAPAVVFAQEVPSDAKGYFDAAAAEFAKGRSTVGIGQLELAIKAFPTYFAALERLGVEYTIKKRYDDARRIFTTAVAVNPRSFNGWYGLSYANFALERSSEAIEAADTALTLEKNAAEVYFVLGMSQRRLKQYDKSEKAFLKAKELDKGKTPDINWNLALLYAHNLQLYGKAADELELFLKAAPDSDDSANIRKLIASFRAKQAATK